LGTCGLEGQIINLLIRSYSFRDAHWRRIRTNNHLERIVREIRRSTRVVGVFPDGRSALMPCAARLCHIAGTKWGRRATRT